MSLVAFAHWPPQAPDILYYFLQRLATDAMGQNILGYLFYIFGNDIRSSSKGCQGLGGFHHDDIASVPVHSDLNAVRSNFEEQFAANRHLWVKGDRPHDFIGQPP
jgi:hypothetical protein